MGNTRTVWPKSQDRSGEPCLCLTSAHAMYCSLLLFVCLRASLFAMPRKSSFKTTPLDKLVAEFVAAAPKKIKPFWALKKTERSKRCLLMGKLLTAVCGEKVRVHQGLKGGKERGSVHMSFERGLEALREEGAVEALQWFRRNHSSLRGLRGAVKKRGVTCRFVEAMKRALAPYQVKGFFLHSLTGQSRTAACAHLRNIVRFQTSVMQARGEGGRRGAGGGPTRVVAAYDGTPFWKASATRCDVFVDGWDAPGASQKPMNWGTWWVFDGGDEAAKLTRMDVRGGLNRQVRVVERGGEYEVFLTGDGKGMIAGNWKQGCRCWMCSLGYKQFSEPSNIAPSEEVEEVARAGAFCPSIPPGRRIGDVPAHGGNRVVNGIFTRVMRDVGGTWGVGAEGKRRVREVWNEVRDEASRLPVAERGDRPPAAKGILDIGATQLFLSQQSFGTKVADAVRGGGV